MRPEWVHPSAGENGYYRWSVPTPELLSMVRSGAQRLTLRERAVLASHTGALLQAGLLGGGDFLQVLELLAEDPAAEVVDGALEGLAGVRAAFVTPQLATDFARWIRRTLTPAAQRFGLEAREGETEAAALLRPDLFTWLGAWGRDEDVAARGRELAARFLEDPRAVDPALVTPALRLAAQSGDWTLFNRLKQKFEAAEAPNDRARFLAALSSFGGEPYQKAALRYSLTGPLRPQELFVVPMNIAQSNLDPGPLLWDWMAANYDAISAKVPPMFMAFMPYFAAGCELSRLETARAFFAQESHRVPGTDKTLEQVAESIGNCARLREREARAVTAYLQGKAGM
jgi:alanyl aminopeptidase